MDAFMEGLEEGKNDIDTVVEDVSTLQTSITNFYNSKDVLSGEAGDAIRTYFKEVHGPFLSFLQQWLENYKETITTMQESVQEFESSPDGFIREEFLEEKVIAGFEKVEDRAQEFTTEANDIIDRVSDIVSLAKIDETEVLEHADNGKKKVRNIVDGYMKSTKRKWKQWKRCVRI